jgi:hypothetical protein
LPVALELLHPLTERATGDIARSDAARTATWVQRRGAEAVWLSVGCGIGGP